MSAYYPQIDCVLIDADGERTAAASLTFDIYNVTTSTSEGTATSNTSGIIASASLGVSDGDILEFTHGTYPGVYRCVAKTLQSSAFSDQGNYGLTYVVENLQTPEDADQAVLIAIDTNNPDARPITLGKALGGTTTDFLVDKSSVSRTWRIYPVSQRKDGSFSQPEYTTLTSTEYEDVTISAFTLGGLAGTQTAKTFFAGPTSGSAATPTFRAISMSDLGTGTPSSSNFLRGDGSWQTVATGLTINSTAISSGTNGQFIYQASGVAAQTPRLTYDGTSVIVGDTASRTSSEIVFKVQADGGFGNFTIFEQKAAGDVVFRDRFAVSVFAYNSSTEIWNSSKTFEIAEIRSSSRYLTPKLVGYNDNNRELNINQTGIAFRLTDASNNAKLLQMYSTAATAQLEVGYDTSNYGQWKVSNSGINTFDAVGSGAKFVFSDAVEVNGSLTLSAQNIVTDTSTGMKIGTGTTQKLGFFNATPVTQRADIGALTDSTGGTPGTTIQDVGGAFDQGTLNDNFASLAAQINALRTEQRDLGFMA